MIYYLKWINLHLFYKNFPIVLYFKDHKSIYPVKRPSKRRRSWIYY
ncbi:DUF3119 family protein [Citroniella saccharovorans]